MGRSLCTVDQLNRFVVNALEPFAWSNLWELTEPNKLGLFYFIMIVRPNVYERHFVYGQQLNDIPSSNSLNPIYREDLRYPDADFFSAYGIRIPMILGNSITKNGKELEKDGMCKFQYSKRLAEGVFTALERMEDIAEVQISSAKEVFGLDKSKNPKATGRERVEAFMSGRPKHEWSLLKEHKNENT